MMSSEQASEAKFGSGVFQLSLCIAALSVSIIIHILAVPFIADDAYIHLRVARNITEHGIPWYNIDQQVFATSSLLYTAFLSVIFSIFGWVDYALKMSVVNGVFAFIAGVEALFFVKRICYGSLKLAYAAGIVTFFLVLPASATGMESAFAIALLLRAVNLIHTKPIRAMLLSTALPLVRPEFIVMPIFVLLAQTFGSSGGVLKTKKITSLVALIIGLSFVATLALLLFGTIVPQSIIAKSQVYSFSLNDTMHTLVSATILFRDLLPARFIYALFLTLLFAAGVITIENLSRKRQSERILVFAVGIIILSAYLIRHAYIFYWYAPLFLVPLFLGILTSIPNLPKSSLMGRVIIYCSILPFVAGGIFAAGAFLFNPSYLSIARANSRTWQYQEIGHALSQCVGSSVKDTKLLASEIGALGFAYHGTVIDAVGLASSEAVKYQPAKIPAERGNVFEGAIPLQIVLDLQPDLIVSMDVFARGLDVPEIDEIYQHIDLPLIPENTGFDQWKISGLWGAKKFRVWAKSPDLLQCL